MGDIFDNFAKQFDTAEAEDDDDAAEQVVQQLSSEDRYDQEEEDEGLAEAQRRVNKAIYYQTIARDGVIEDNGSKETAEINAEARLWARQQMKKLINGASEETVAAPVVQLPFSEKEIFVLKKLIEKAIPVFFNGEIAPEPPVVKKVQTSATAPAPAPAAPAIKRVQTQSHKPVPKKVVAPTAKAPPKPAPAPAKMAPAEGPKKPLRVKKGADGDYDYDSIPTDQVFKDPKDNQLYKYVPHPQEDNRRIKRKVTNQVRNVGAIPMPTQQQQSMISQQKSMESVDLGSSANSIFPDDKFGGDVLVAAAAKAMVK